eukprot:11743728-Ditylum_brightwellii.AAC.1
MNPSNMADDDVIIIPTHVIEFFLYNNEVDIGNNIILARELLCHFDKWAISAMLMDGDTIGYVARIHYVLLGPVLDFISRNEAGVTSAYIM